MEHSVLNNLHEPCNHFSNATGVDKVQTEADMNHATYDLYGRKVNKITTPGLYIVNGKKVWVK